MSAFECNITPTRFRVEKKRNEDREPTLVDLRPFSGRSIVTFENVPISKTARRIIIISNPFEEILVVTLSKLPKPENNLSFEWTQNQIAPQSQINLELVWSPLSLISCRETLQISDQHGNKKDVAVVLKSCSLNKKTSRKVAPSGFPKKLKLKTPSPPNNPVRARKPPKENREVPMSPLRNATNLPQPDFFERLDMAACISIIQDKENAPSTPTNVSSLFDNIRFTPLTETKPKCESKLEYLASLPTPVAASHSSVVTTNITRRRIIESPVAPTRLLHDLPTPQQSKTVHRETAIDEINEIEIILNEETQILSSHQLCVISEEEQVAPQSFHKTFEVNKTRSMSEIRCSMTEINSESMKDLLKVPDAKVKKLRCNQGSMPNLNDDVGSIENNRYFGQKNEPNISLESLISNADFQEFETCAQSSRLFGDEFDSPSKLGSNAEVRLMRGSPRDKQDSPTIRRIQHESSSKSSTRKNCLVFSPPPRRTLSTDLRDSQALPRPSSGQSIRATTWKQQQNQQMFAVPKAPRDLTLRPKLVTQSLSSLSTTSIASANSTSSTPAQLTSGKLYNENYINTYTRHDPFSATTTIDPFLSSTMYLDEQNLDKIEKSYMKWLNALVTIPADLESDVNEKIDVGKLFNDVQNKELTFAPTKEAVVSKYYTSRLDSLRNAAIQLFHSEQIAVPLNKLTVIINEKNKLDIKADRNIHLDLVLQRSLLELLLCYNPLWLRIGIEVVMNVQLNLTSNRDIFGMTRFIISNLFKSPYLAEKYSKFSQRNEFLEKLRKHTVKNFLFIIFFLDRAKENRLIKQNPCLFVKRAPFKESAEILKKFASLVIANYGDIIRTLRRLDYSVTHKQTTIDEFNFAFTNLAVDLRDGVRLTKVMEVILMQDDLVQKVRVPAISRLQKVYNVDLALKALEAADYRILGNITSKDIADGHREKTLSLLWQIIYKFRAPRFNAAAVTIQRFWRSKFLKIVINRRIRTKKQAELDRAATVIQKVYRGWKARQAVKVQREKLTTSCVTIQKNLRRAVARRRFQKQIQSIVVIQRWYRQVRTTRAIRTQFLIQIKSTVVIQKWWRRQVLARKLVASSHVIKEMQAEAFGRHRAALAIQQKFRARILMKIERTRFLELRSAVICIQQRMRAQQSMKIQRREYLEIRQTVVRIQQRFRADHSMKLARDKFQMLKQAAITIQMHFRANQLMKTERKAYVEMKSAAIKIQKWLRSYQLMEQERHHFLSLKQTVLTMENRIVANKLMTVERKRFLTLKRAAFTIQTRFRATLLMKSEREAYLAKKCAAVKIQTWFRSYQVMKQERHRFLMLKQIVLLVENRIVANKLMLVERLRFLELKRTVTSVQTHFRAIQLMKTERNIFLEKKSAAIKIQKWFRSNQLMKQERSRFLMLKQTVLQMENRIVANKMMRAERERFLTLKRAVICIEQQFRARQSMKIQRHQYVKLRQTVVMIQLRFRANQMMKTEHQKFQMLKRAAITIQTRVRANQLMQSEKKAYVEMKSAATKIQKWLRSYQLMKRERSRFLLLKRTVLTMENRIVANHLMSVERERFLTLKRAAVTIQTRFRATSLMKSEREAYLAKKSAAIVFQHRFRALQEKNKQQLEFQRLKSSAITIQTRFRAWTQMKAKRQEFLLLKQSAVLIQQKLRAKSLMSTERTKFQKIRSAAVCIQQRFRAHQSMKIARHNYTETRKAAVTIQQRFRANQSMKTDRDKFQTLKRASSVIQMHFRANQLMKTERKAYVDMKCAAIKIQKWFRSNQLMKQERHRFLMLKQTVLTVENRILANRLMQVERVRFLEIKRTVLFVQKRVRSKLETKRLQSGFIKLRQTVVKLQARVRGNQARTRFQALQTPENIELRKRQKAARTIQAAYRGYRERNKKENRCFRVIVDRLLKVTKNVEPAQTLGAKLKSSLAFLRTPYDSNVAISFLAKLEYMSRIVPWILIQDAEFIACFCYGVMSQAIRSEVDKQVIELCSCIILNMSRYKDTKESAFQDHGLITISQMLLRWCDKDCGIFNTLCTLVWVFSHCEVKKQTIKAFMTRDGEFILSQISSNVSRKENMRKNSRRPIGFQSISLIKYKKDFLQQQRYNPQSTAFSSGFITPEMLRQCHELPSLHSDYGVVKTMPYIFYSSVFAFDHVLKKLDLRKS